MKSNGICRFCKRDKEHAPSCPWMVEVPEGWTPATAVRHSDRHTGPYFWHESCCYAFMNDDGSWTASDHGGAGAHYPTMHEAMGAAIEQLALKERDPDKWLSDWHKRWLTARALTEATAPQYIFPPRPTVRVERGKRP